MSIDWDALEKVGWEAVESAGWDHVTTPAAVAVAVEGVLQHLRPQFEELAALREALELLRPAHHTPYADEDHQGGNCVDWIMPMLARIHHAERAVQKVREWCDESEASEDWLGVQAEIRALLPEVAP